jgi:hypothetical protein
METERIALSQRERDRLRVLHEIKRKQITRSKRPVYGGDTAAFGMQPLERMGEGYFLNWFYCRKYLFSPLKEAGAIIVPRA